MTIKDRLEQCKGYGPGFDFARLFLSATILCWHSVVTTQGHAAELAVWSSPFSAPLAALMPMFFALSGFLVMGSVARLRDLGPFIASRGLRIIPALLVEILISSFLLGSAVTTLPLHEYFFNPGFIRYFGSLIGKVSLSLPGVFVSNPAPSLVNISLWTIGPELSCYVYLGLQVALKLGRIGTTVCAVVLLAINILADWHVPAMSNGVVASRLLILSFAFGNLLFVWQDCIPLRADLFTLFVAVGLASVRVPHMHYVIIASCAYVVVFIGLCRLPLPSFFAKGDYSYGVYLYAFPIQQMFAYLFPEHRSMLLSIVVCLPVTFCAAMASWWLVERPCLRLRKLLVRKSDPLRPVNIQNIAIGTTILFVYGAFLTASNSLFGTLMQMRYLLMISLVLAAASVVLRAAYLKPKDRMLGAGSAE